MAGINRAYKRRGNMVVNTGAPVLCLDAGSKLSYPGSGTTWSDLSGNGNNGTLTNGPTYNSANYGSIVFDGINDRVPTSLNTGGYTALSAAAWFKTLTATTVVVGDFAAGGWPVSSFIVYIDGNIATFYVPSPSTIYLGRDSAAAVRTGNWVYVCGVYHGATGSMNMYVNGVLSNGSGSNTAPPSLSAVTSGVTIGSANAPLFYFNGSIGQVTIYNRALSAAEINTNFQLARGRYGI